MKQLGSEIHKMDQKDKKFSKMIENLGFVLRLLGVQVLTRPLICQVISEKLLNFCAQVFSSKNMEVNATYGAGLLWNLNNTGEVL